MTTLISVKRFYDADMILTGMVVADLLIAEKISDYTYCEEVSMDVSHGMLIIPAERPLPSGRGCKAISFIFVGFQYIFLIHQE